MQPAIKHIEIIINPASGKNRPILNTLNDVFRQYDIEWNVSLTHQHGDAERLAQEIIHKNPDLVMVYGGDGTLFEVINGMSGSDLPIAILPGGTGNAAAKALNYPKKIESILHAVGRNAGHIRPIDIGQLNDSYFLSQAATSWSFFAPERGLKDRYGFAAYGIMLLRDLPKMRPTTYQLTIDGSEHECRGLACIVTNINLIGFNTTMGPNVQADDGQFDVFVIGTDRRSIRGMVQGVFRPINFERAFHHWQGRDIHVETDTPQPLGADGDPLGQTPFTAKVLPRALNVFVPHSSQIH